MGDRIILIGIGKCRNMFFIFSYLLLSVLFFLKCFGISIVFKIQIGIPILTGVKQYKLEQL